MTNNHFIACACIVASTLTFACSSDSTPATPGDSAASDDTATTDTSKDEGGTDTGTPTDSGSEVVADVSDSAGDAVGDGGRDLGTDKTTFFGASRCASAKVLLCEDFESGTLDTKTWTVNGTAPVIDGVQHARGSKALHITKNGNGSSYIKETKTFPAPKNTYFGRMFVYFNQLPTAPGMSYAHWTFAAASGTGVTGEIRLSGQLQSTGNHFGVGTDSGTDPKGTGDWTNSDKDPGGKPLAVPTKEWLCIEWMHDGATNETRFWWDAVEHASLYTSATVHGGNSNPYTLPTFTNVWIGWAEYQASTQTFEEWVDEIIIDKERIGCVL